MSLPLSTICSSQTAGLIWTKLVSIGSNLLLWNIPWMTLFKNCLQNFDPSVNMALVNGGYLHYTDLKKFLKNLLLWNRWSEFHKNVPWVSLFKNCLRNFDLSIKMALVNGGYLYYKDMKKFLKNPLLWNQKSDFEVTSQKCSLVDHLQKLWNFDP